MEYFQKKLEKMVDILLTPFWNSLIAWLKQLSWLGRLLIMTSSLCVLGIFIYQSHVTPYYRIISNIPRVITEKPGFIPINTQIVAKLKETEIRLVDSLQGTIEYLSKPNSEHKIDIKGELWSIAQAIVGRKGLTNFDQKQVQESFRKFSVAECGCWQENSSTGSPQSIPKTSWIIFAFADIDIPATNSEIRFILNQQHLDGSWSFFRIVDNPRYSSTYATAWAVLALNNQLSKNLIKDQLLSNEVSKAIKMGASWLTMQRITTKSRWKHYPGWVDSAISESISGLVVHVLHQVSPKSVAKIESDWLKNLPIDDGIDEIELTHLPSIEGYHPDSFVHNKLPWLLIATIDSYANGDFFQRANALHWIENTIDQESVLNADTQPINWKRAELLYSIKYLLDRSQAM